ncbi:MAG: 2-C-methyl-D-erythritol 2,4-cyclodiphosphate synthase [Patescibacteria group bacterium]|nr:2-C-methyl-D-erythritol 2,4-cyclodiphosphate synthase [Patescibacteria group bacterium]
MNIGIILAGGQGWRLEAGTKKAFVTMLGLPMLHYSLADFLASDHIDIVVVVIPPGCIREFNKVASRLPPMKEVYKLTGGTTRFKSLKKAFKAIEKNIPEKDLKTSNIIIHNAANPGVGLDEIQQVVEALDICPAAGIAVPLTDTLRQIKSNSTMTIPRDNLWRMQTPQGLHYKTLKEGIKLAKEEPTDDLQLAELQNIKPKIIPGAAQNFKVTSQTDFDLMESLVLAKRQHDTGIGEDFHLFGEREPLILGGMEFPDYNRLEADSDGDVMLHALITALLQYMGEGSLGKFIEPIFEEGGGDSRYYLEKAFELLDRDTFQHWITKIQFVFEGEIPSIDRIAPRLKKSVGKLCSVPPHIISIAAHTGEGLTEGLRCMCLISFDRIWLG